MYLPGSAGSRRFGAEVRDRFEGWTTPRSPSDCSMDARRPARRSLSPDGTRIAFVVAIDRPQEERHATHGSGSTAPRSPPARTTATPKWSPDGRFLAFTSRRGEKKGDSTLHILPVAGPGETRTLCTMPDGLGDLEWSPDGRWIAFTSRTRDERYEAEDVSWQAPRKIERFFSRLNGEDWIFDRPQHIYVVAADGTGTPRNLTPGDFQHNGITLAARLVGDRHEQPTPRHLGSRPRHRSLRRPARRRRRDPGTDEAHRQVRIAVRVAGRPARRVLG